MPPGELARRSPEACLGDGEITPRRPNVAQAVPSLHPLERPGPGFSEAGRRGRGGGLPRGGGALHNATYSRKPHGLAADLRGDAWRFSLCCAVCRREEMHDRRDCRVWVQPCGVSGRWKEMTSRGADSGRARS